MSIVPPPPSALDSLRGIATIPVAGPPPSLMTVLECGRDAAYQAVATGAVPSIRVGRFIRVPVPALLRLLSATHNQPHKGEQT